VGNVQKNIKNPIYYSQWKLRVKGKSKVVPVRNLIKHYAMKTYGGVDL
jgi:hypothetical protein